MRRDWQRDGLLGRGSVCLFPLTPAPFDWAQDGLSPQGRGSLAGGHDVIDAWLSGLRDRRAVARMAARMERLELGLLGDCRSVKGGVMELRIDYGPGYRVYFAPIQQRVILLLGGGTKGTQQADIAEAKARLKNWRSRP